MEYVEGLDLARMVKAKGPMPVSHACSFIHQAALGLQHAHQAGMVHRDIKPGNLMLTREGDRAIIKVLDFGIAKAGREQEVLDPAPNDEGRELNRSSDLTAFGQMMGTPGFIAPEQIVDAQKADIRDRYLQPGLHTVFPFERPAAVRGGDDGRPEGRTVRRRRSR